MVSEVIKSLVLNRHDQAIQYYEQALQIAEKVGNKEYQAKALLGVARTEMYGLKKYGSAATHVQTALALTAGLEKKDLHIDALDYQAQAQIFQGDLIEALATLKRALAMAVDTKDESRLFYIYLDRAKTYQKLGEPCNDRPTHNACYEAFELSQANYKEAKRLAGKFGWHGLVNQIDEFLQGLEIWRKIIQSLEKSYTQLALGNSLGSRDLSMRTIQEHTYVLKQLGEKTQKSNIVITLLSNIR